MNEQTRNALELARASLENFWLNGQSTQSERAEASQAIAAIDAVLSAPAAPVAQQTPVAWLYTLEYGSSIVDRRVSADRLRYPFGVCGADYLRTNDDGVSYVRETPLGVIAHGIGQGGDDA